MNYDGLKVQKLLFRTKNLLPDGGGCQHTIKVVNPQKVLVREKVLKNGMVEVTIRFTANPKETR